MAARTSNREKTFHVLLGVTGSVAATKLIELTRKIKTSFPQRLTNKTTGVTINASINIRILLTENAKYFSPKEGLVESLSQLDVKVYEDADEWSHWSEIGDPVLHIELRKWADLCLIAPLDANTMAKIANGICDNLLTCVIRAWDVSKPLVYCPAMNVQMYNHPITKEHLCKLQSFGYLRVGCIEKRLACGDFGLGAMASLDSITNKVIECLSEPFTRKLLFSKPLLDQQPTYPIVSTTDDKLDSELFPGKFSPSLNSQLLNRFRINNQITIHHIPNTNLHSESKVCNELDRNRSSKKESFTVQSDNRNRKNTGRAFNNRITPKTMRLRSDKNGSPTKETVQNSDLPTYDRDEDLNFHFDPTNLLEQTMIIDESTPLEYNHKYSSVTSPGQNSITSEKTVAKLDGLTPLFNTSKFLSLCHNKERNCFTCTICKNDYKNRKSMARHLKEQHVQGNIYKCKPCGVSYKRREKLIKHNRERHP